MLASGRENRTSLGWLRSSITGEFPGGPVVRTPCFHCREHRFNPWSGNYNPANWDVWPKKNISNSITFRRPKCSAPQQWRACVDRMSWGGKLGRALMGTLGWGSPEWWEEERWLLPEDRDVVLRSLPWWWWFIWGWGGGWIDRLWASSDSCWNTSTNRRDHGLKVGGRWPSTFENNKQQNPEDLVGRGEIILCDTMVSWCFVWYILCLQWWTHHIFVKTWSVQH